MTAKTNPGRHEAADPADTVSKRMIRLFVAFGLDPSPQKMFHGLRHNKIVEVRDAGFDPRTNAPTGWP